MKLTLWFLNRITQWEVERPGELSRALAGRSNSSGEPLHDVRLGRRGLPTPATANSGTVDLAVNHTEASFRGELMHEGHQQKVDGTGKSAYDEYFMPIPLKCLGKPNYDRSGKPQLTAFWREMILPDRQEELLRILTPGDSDNHCFEPALVDEYWQPGKRGVRGDSELAREFSDVRMNTDPAQKIGYYQMLQQAKEKHGPNVLIGYSQAGAVVNYLAYIDEHFVDPRKRCILGVISANGALRGSTFAMASRQQAVLHSLTRVILAIREVGLVERLSIPPIVREHIERLSAGRRLDIDQVTELLDHLYGFAKSHKDLNNFIRTARKWLSGLHRDKQLAFWDLDSERLNQPGSVMQALDNNPLMDTLCAAVAGTNSQLEPLLRSVIQFADPRLGRLEVLFRDQLRQFVHRSELIFQAETFEMMPEDLAPPNLALTRLRSEWQSDLTPSAWAIQNDVPVPLRATDCVIPSASQLMTPGAVPRPKFLGNYINEDASHISGALLNDTGQTDFDFVKTILGRMSGDLPLAQTAAG